MGAAIPLHRPHTTGHEAARVAEALATGHWRGDGRFTRQAAASLSARLGGAAVRLTTSCTHALELAALLLEVGPGDEVIVPAFTFVTTANAFALRGATIVFADVDPRTLCLAPASVAARVTPRTRAIVPVHYAGVACDLDALAELAAAAPGRPTIVEDNAHGLFGAWRGRPLGSIAPLATLSFHDTKNIACGEGGALVINDPAWVARADILREKGTDRSRFVRGEVDKYTWVDVGSSYLPSELLAAVLVAQLEDAERIQAARHAIWSRYQRELAAWAQRVGAQQPHLPDGAVHPAHLYWLRMASLDVRSRLLAHLAAAGVGATFHYPPLHLSAMGRRYGGAPGLCPVAEATGDTLLRLPLYPGLTPGEVDRVVDAVTSFAP